MCVFKAFTCARAPDTRIAHTNVLQTTNVAARLSHVTHIHVPGQMMITAGMYINVMCSIAIETSYSRIVGFLHLFIFTLL